MTILSTTDVMKSAIDVWGRYVLFGVIVFLLFGLVFYAAECYKTGLVLIVLSAICALATITSLFLNDIYDYTKIECTLNDEYPAKKLLKDYEILEIRDDIYELKYIDEDKTNAKN